MTTALRCLLGRTAPADLGANLATLASLPEPVLEAYAEVLEPNLAPMVDDRVETLVKRFCKRFEIEPSALGPSIIACRFLFTNMIVSGAPRDALEADIRALLDERADSVLPRVLALFDAAAPKLRKDAVFLSVAEHGKVVRAVHWRLDRIQSSDHGANLDVPVATITLQYQEGPTVAQATYHLLPDQAMALRRALARIID
jgi:hypothetical protein